MTLYLALAATVAVLLAVRRARKRRRREHTPVAPVVVSLGLDSSGPRLAPRKRGRQGNL